MKSLISGSKKQISEREDMTNFGHQLDFAPKMNSKKKVYDIAKASRNDDEWCENDEN